MNDNKTVCDDWEKYLYDAEECSKVSCRYHQERLKDVFIAIHKIMINGGFKAKTRYLYENEIRALERKGFGVDKINDNCCEVYW